MNNKKLIIAGIITTLIFLIIRIIGVINNDLLGLDILFAGILLIRMFLQLKKDYNYKTIKKIYNICIISNVIICLIFLSLILIKNLYLPNMNTILLLKNITVNTSYFVETFSGYFNCFSIMYLLLNVLLCSYNNNEI